MMYAVINLVRLATGTDTSGADGISNPMAGIDTAASPTVGQGRVTSEA